MPEGVLRPFVPGGERPVHEAVDQLHCLGHVATVGLMAGLDHPHLEGVDAEGDIVLAPAIAVLAGVGQ